MKQCNSCRLYFDELNQAGKCADCAPAQRNQMEDQELNALRNNVASLTNTVQQLTSQQAPPQPVDPRTAMNQAFWQNPADASYALATRAAAEQVGAQMAQSFEGLRELARDKARATNPDLFDRFSEKIDGLVQTMPREAQIQKQYWISATERVIGAHYNDLRREEQEAAREGKPKAPAFHGSSDGPARAGVPAAAATGSGGAELSDDAKMIARRMRLSEDQMRKGIEIFASQGDPFDPSKPSSWDKAMSFGDFSGPRARLLAHQQGAAAWRPHWIFRGWFHPLRSFLRMTSRRPNERAFYSASRCFARLRARSTMPRSRVALIAFTAGCSIIRR